MQYERLYQWGLTEQFLQEASIYEGFLLARVTEQHKNLYQIICEEGSFLASVSGKLMHEAKNNGYFPAVGDFVMISLEGGTAVIHHVLKRKSVFSRKAAGTAHEVQIVAANVDMVFICMALNENYNIRRLERYLSVSWDSGATPLVVLTKADLCDNVSEKLEEVAQIALGAEVVVCSSLIKDGYQAVLPYVGKGKTVACIGSSGVGKSTLINHLIGKELFATNDIREDGKGRHTTTHRQLIPLPGGGVLIDTPGMRELGAVSADVQKGFSDIEELSDQCKFRNCSHQNEPGCAVRAAILEGSLDEGRLQNYQKIQTEIGYHSLSSKQIEEEKIKRMFGSKQEMKTVMREFKNKNK